MEWRPIGSAPRDGTAVLLTVNGLTLPGYWREQDEDAVRLDRAAGGWFGWTPIWVSEFALAAPTHWMPLPAPPGQPLPGGE